VCWIRRAKFIYLFNTSDTKYIYDEMKICEEEKYKIIIRSEMFREFQAAD
jgi:hypothetical protein